MLITKMTKKMKPKTKKILISIVVVVALLLTVIAMVPGSEKIVPAPVAEFADKFYSVAIAAVFVVIGLLTVTSSPIIGVGLLLIGAMIIYNNLTTKKPE